MNAFSSTELTRPEWQALIQRDGNEQPRPTLANALLLLENDPPLAGLLRFDAFRVEYTVTRPPPAHRDGAVPLAGPYPRQWDEPDVSLVQAYLQRNHGHRWGKETVLAAMIAHAAHRVFHPVREWLAGLAWDGRMRIDRWLTRAFGAEATPYVEAVGAKFLIAAVRRIRQPGCKFDTMPVLEGGQGIGKSTVVKTLFGADLFTDSIPHDFANKEAAQSLLGVWGIEFAEIEALIRSEVETIKAFLSRTTDRFRPPYGKVFVQQPRQCVFVGTTNSADYLRDSTGNRRIWPIRCKHADVEWIKSNREQLWAEAAAREATGEATWLHDPDTAAEAVHAQRERMADDVWTERVREYCAEQLEVRTALVLQLGLGMAAEKQNRQAQMRVADILKADGWKAEVGWRDGKTTRFWGRGE